MGVVDRNLSTCQTTTKNNDDNSNNVLEQTVVEFLREQPPPQLLLPLREDPKEPNTWFLRPTRVHNPTGISISFSVFAGFIVEPNR